MTILLRSIHSISENKDPSPNGVLNKIIDSMQEGLSGEQSLDIVYAIFDRKKFELNYILLGDIFIAHQEHSTGKLNYIQSNNSSLHKTSHFDLKIKTIKLNPNDRLVFITKGGYLSKGHNDEVFGKENLMKSIASAPKTGAHELRNYISYSLKKFLHNDKPQRDTTIVVAEVKDRVIKLA